MATVKLTLSIPKKLLSEAKDYSQRTGEPLSQLVGRYFAVLAKALPKRKLEEEGHVTTKVRGITGLAKSDKEDQELLWEALSHKHR